MPNYRRLRVKGGTYFFTVVTYKRLPIFKSDASKKLLHSTWNKVQTRLPFSTEAICLLPDHIHTIWTLPKGDDDYSTRWKEIKRLFSRAYIKEFGNPEIPNNSRRKHHEFAIWQRRFWEHTIQDEDDLYNHLDYIHYNPVKHGLANSPAEWKWSSFSIYVDREFYEPNWGENEILNKNNIDYGE